MHSIAGLVAAAAISGVAGAGQIIDQPQWVETPTVQDLSALYPDKAFKLKVKGLASLECTIGEDGRPTKCQVLDLSPRGRGFDEAAEVAALLFRMATKDSTGASLVGRLVRLNLEFPIPTSFDTPPRIINGPTVSDMLAVWPTAAHGREGWALLRCVITVRGVPDRCQVVTEGPPGKGFGGAALVLAPNLLYRPATLGGQSVEAPYVQRIRWVGEGPVTSPSYRMVNNLEWRSAPTAADVASAYPKYALAKARSGRVVIRCGIKPGGELRDCSAISEEPEGYGFANAAQSLTSKFRAYVGDTPADTLKTVRLNLPIQFAPPPAPGAPPRRLAKADWTTQPDPDTIYAAFPAKAADAGVNEGRGFVDCAVREGGPLSECKTTSEEPSGLGFGDSAVAVASLMAVNPWTDEGEAAEGAHVEFSIRFIHKEPDSPPAAAQPSKGS
jgi:TonB family protein